MCNVIKQTIIMRKFDLFFPSEDQKISIECFATPCF